MKLNDLKLLIQEYDNLKGRGRRLFGDALPIKVLKKLIRAKETTLDHDQNDSLNISLQDYLDFAHSRGYNIDLSENYLNSNRASANVFLQWKQRDTESELIRQISLNLTSFEFTLPDLTSFRTILNRIEFNPAVFQIEPIPIPQLNIVNIAPSLIDEDLQQLLQRQTNISAFFHSPLNMNDTSMTQHHTDEDDNEDEDDYINNSSSMFARAA